MPPNLHDAQNGQGQPGGAGDEGSSTATAQTEGLNQETLLRAIKDMITEVRDLLTAQHTIRDYYSTEQVAKILGKANWTVREWCRLGRVHAEKRRSGRGRAKDWVVSHAELLRIEKEELLPVPKYRA